MRCNSPSPFCGIADCKKRLRSHGRPAALSLCRTQDPRRVYDEHRGPDQEHPALHLRAAREAGADGARAQPRRLPVIDPAVAEII
jgi:hypothetical protein